MTTTTTPLPTWTWTESLEGLQEWDTNVGGDIQVGPNFDRRYTRQLDDGTWTVITDSWYAANFAREGEEPNYDVINSTEILHCTDPEDAGGTETGSEILTPQYCAYLTLHSAEDAIALAGKLAKMGGPEDFEHYNGVPRLAGDQQ
ncbi:hypothetical protein [Agromyces humi]|uniref:hypothetical protein n=1 Tax=Agromyces humi TaxID=1766800 RepID=UPI001356BEF9|nr:hypothetical protein [Agromyces humi]